MISLPPVKRVAMLPHFETTCEQHFALMGEILLFQTNEQSLLEAAAEAFGRFPFPDPPPAKPLVVRLFVREGAPGQPQAQPRPIFSTQGHIFSMTVGAENLGVADLQQGFACGYVTPQVASDGAFVRYTFIEGLGYAMLSMARGYAPLHAACVVKHGVAVILQASAGIGKSTLAYACLRRGYQLLAEDVVHVKTSVRPFQLWGAPWKFHLLPDAVNFFPELAGRQALLQMNAEWKLELDLEEHRPGSTVVCAPPGPVVMLRRGTPGQTHLEFLEPDEASRTFEVLWPWDSGWTEEHERAISSLLSKGAHYLWMNGSPDEAVEALDRLVEAYA